MGLAAALGFVRRAVQSESSAGAEFHYRIFEAEATLVDRLIPPATRTPGVMLSVKPLTDFGRPVSERQVGSFKMRVQEGITESQMAEINADTLRALLDGMAAEPGLLTEQRRMIRSWPLVADSWGCSRADANFFGSSGGPGFLGARRKNGVLQARIECSVSDGLDARHAHPPLRVYSRILYEGNAPTNGALAFLVPFLRHNDVPRYLVCLFEITDKAAPRSADTAFTRNPAAIKLPQDEPKSAALKPIPPKAAELAAAWMLNAKAYGESEALRDTNVQVTIGKVASVRLKEVEDLLKGTVAEPLVKQQREAIAELRKASQAKDMEKVRAAQNQIRAVSKQLEQMLGLTEAASGSAFAPAAEVTSPQ